MVAFAELIKEDLESQRNLLDQYKKELRDLNERRGLYYYTPAFEVPIAKKRLQESIRDIEENVLPRLQEELEACV